MASLKEQLLQILPQVLPEKPEQALNGTKLIDKVKDLLDKDYAEGSLRAHLSALAADPTSPIAKVEQGQGYYRRPIGNQLPDIAGTDQTSTAFPPCDQTADDQGRETQREEKFRALFLRYAELSNQFPVHIEHTKGMRRAAGVNKWKFPDVVALQWDVGEPTEKGGFKLVRDLLEVKKSLGEPPFKVMSIELKVELNLGSFRENFFQCVSNSKWAHAAILAVAGNIPDTTLAEELRRLGTSYDVTVHSYGLDLDYLDRLPTASEIAKVPDSQFDEIANQFTFRQIVSGKERENLDWEHIRDLRRQSSEFNSLFKWIAYCLEKKTAYRYSHYQQMVQIDDSYR